MILFDLDDTLYSPKRGVVQRIDARINRYLEDLDYVPKPAPAAFERVLGRFETRAAGATLIDDNAKNVAAAKALGMRTIWVGNVAENGGPGIEGADAVVSSIHELRALYF